MIDLFLRQRIHQMVPERFALLRDDPSGGIKFATAQGPAIVIHAIYTADAEAAYLETPDGPCLLIDYRFVDFVLDLVAAAEIEDEELRTTAVMFVFYSLTLEQSLGSPEGPLHTGLFLDYLVSRVSASAFYGFDGHDSHDLGRAEFVTRLVTVHEATHAQLAIDAGVREGLLEQFTAEIDHLLRHAEKAADDQALLVDGAAQIAKKLLNQHDKSARPNVELEELLCDFAMVKCTAEAVIADEGKLARADRYFTLTSATLTAIWALSTVRGVARSLLASPPSAEPDPGENRDVRNVLAMMTFLRIIGVALADRGVTDPTELAEIWTGVEDYERICVDTINRLYSRENLNRLIQIGEISRELDCGPPAGGREAIRKILGWV